MIFPGVAGLISLLVGFVSLQILPFNYAGLILLFLAMALLISEVYVTSYGLLSLAALGCLVFERAPAFRYARFEPRGQQRNYSGCGHKHWIAFGFYCIFRDRLVSSSCSGRF